MIQGVGVKIMKKYVIKSRLKVGGFGAVYLANGIGEDYRHYAIKIIPMKYERYANIEFDMYEQIKKFEFSHGFIKKYDYGKVGDKLFLAMELLGPDLEELMLKRKPHKFSSKTVLMIGLQVIDRIEALHKIGYIHRDIKPDNLAIGTKQKEKVIYLFDFGLAKQANKAKSAEQKGKMVGTLAYMSIRCHEGKQTGIIDDIESFIYTLVFLVVGTLPWMKINVQSPKDYDKIKNMKLNFNKKWFLDNYVPIELYQIYQYIKQVKSEDLDYLNIKYKLMNGLKSLNTTNDFDFDWCKKTKSKNNQSPRQRIQERERLEKMNEFNQKQIQQQIYEIYKFMDNDKKSPEKNLKRNQSYRGAKKISPERNKKIETYKKQVKPRPVTAKKNKQHLYNKIQEQISHINSMKFDGPRIVINRTAAHKI